MRPAVRRREQGLETGAARLQAMRTDERIAETGAVHKEEARTDGRVRKKAARTNTRCVEAHGA